MSDSVLVFVSHSSVDKEDYVEPLVADLRESYINVWFDKTNIVPGQNLRNSIFKNGLDKADIALIIFTKESLQSAWVDKEIKHVLRGELKKGNNFDISKIISIFDSQETLDAISDRYPELTDDLLHLMPKGYDKIKLAQLVSAIWSKYLGLQGGDVEVQKQLLEKDKIIFQREKDNKSLEDKIKALEEKALKNEFSSEFEKFYQSGLVEHFIQNATEIVSRKYVNRSNLNDFENAVGLGLISTSGSNDGVITKLGSDFVKWLILNKQP